jgi:hypothetical protein
MIDNKTKELKMELKFRFELSKVLPTAGVIYKMIDNLPNTETVKICGVPYVLLPKAARYFDKDTKNIFGAPTEKKKIFTLDDYEILEVVKVDNPEDARLYIFKLPGGNGIYDIAVIIKDIYHFYASCSIFDVWWIEEGKFKFVMERLPFNMENADEKEKSDFIWTSAHIARRSIAVATLLYTFINFDFEGANSQIRLCSENSRDYAISVKEKIKSLGSNLTEAIENLEILDHFI